MNGNASSYGFDSKPLPPPLRDDNLPPIPGSDQQNMNSWSNAPLPPPKIDLDFDPTPPTKSNSSIRLVPPIDTSGSLAPFDSGLVVQPITPMTPTGFHPSAPPSPSADGKPKKTNPLMDLIETEKVYVELLTGIIRKVAGAWSRSNLPPPELDAMFRGVEGVYRANRSLLGKLKELGSNPSSPKALGDLLMRWIDDLETPYTNYSNNYCAGFDVWEPVQSNSRLRTTLAIFSSSNPPPLPPTSPPHPAEPPLWTLDDLFLLPKDRLRYYRKLYGRLLKGTTPGRSDHKLLTGALEKLESLLITLDNRANIKVGGDSAPQDDPPATEDEVVIDLRSRDSNGFPLKNNFMLGGDPSNHRGSDSTSRSESMVSSRRVSEDTAPTSDGRGSMSAAIATIADLERRLSTERTLDIFTMTPKQVRLQISPPTLHYTRELRLSADALFRLVPRSTGVEIVQERGHVFILTDLLLICERMTREEQARFGSEGPDMWLLYPPLAGKHLRVAAVEGSATALNVTILRKEVLTLQAESPQLRDKLIHEFRECIDAGAALTPAKNQAPPPPVPALPGMNSLPKSPSASRERTSDPPSARSSGSASPPTRAYSPPVRGPSSGQPPFDSISDSMSRMGLGPDSRVPPMGNPMPGQMHPPRSNSTTSPPPNGPNFGPGQFLPINNFGPGQSLPSPSSAASMHSLGPGQGVIVPPPRGTSNGYRGGAPPPGGGLPPRPGQFNDLPSPMSPYGPSPTGSRPPSSGSYGGNLRKSPSSRSIGSQYDHTSNGPLPPMPAYPEGLPPPRPHFLPRTDSSNSLSSLQAPQPRPLLPSAQFRGVSTAGSFIEPSPPNSPVEETPPDLGPVTSTISAQMKCKVFLKQQHAQWKNLGSAKLKLYRESPTNIKQLVVEADNSKKNILISTIVLVDGVERVGKTGVAIELSDKGQRTGIVYMLQLRNESSAGGLFDSLLAGSDRFGTKSN